MARAPLCSSLSGNAVDVLTITAPGHIGLPLEQRRGVVLSGKGSSAGVGFRVYGWCCQVRGVEQVLEYRPVLTALACRV